ncbi:MAG: TaqI-like C-terminal specificity domain-containing protein, partial [bacterium]|nr:TaqI-like C-terminal specificity domain-containing protein [bacterium]
HAGKPLKTIANINQAIALKYDRSKSLFKTRDANNYKKVLDGRNIHRYYLEWGGYYLAYDINKIHSCKRTDIFDADEKIFFRRVGDRLIATYDDSQFYALNTLVVITLTPHTKISLKYLLGLINSSLMNFYYVTYLKSTKKVFSEIQARQLSQLPINIINFADPADVARHDLMVSLVEKMLSLQKELAAAKIKLEKNIFQRQIVATDRQIDQLVYQLYGLTDEEIKIVEEAVK